MTDAEVVQLEVKPCAAAEPLVEEEPVLAKSGNETSENPASDKESVTGNIIKSIEKSTYDSNDYLVALMLIAITVVAIMIVLLLIIIFK